MYVIIISSELIKCTFVMKLPMSIVDTCAEGETGVGMFSATSSVNKSTLVDVVSVVLAPEDVLVEYVSENKKFSDD